MDVELGELYGVVSGDIVGSSKLGPIERESLFRVMKDGANELKNWLGHTMPLELDIYGGDSWQMLVTNPGKTLAAGLFYRAYLQANSPKCDTRFVAAIGTIDFVPGKQVSEGDGEAFRLSGQSLATGLRKRKMGFVCSDQSATRRWDLVFYLVDSLVSHWSEKQAKAILGALRGWKQEEIAARWSPPIEQPSVNRLLRLGNWHAVERSIPEFEEFWAVYKK